MIHTLLDRLRPERPAAPAADPIRRFVATLEALETPPKPPGGGRVRALDLLATPFTRAPRSPS
jgi:hypothetical protein